MCECVRVETKILHNSQFDFELERKGDFSGDATVVAIDDALFFIYFNAFVLCFFFFFLQRFSSASWQGASSASTPPTPVSDFRLWSYYPQTTGGSMATKNYLKQPNVAVKQNQDVKQDD